ncbi:MAG: yncB 2 [Devosia sp.]|uniref:thermonuclease family protein n=1 Tax=Devosia sp. TaxID=1871048 RepID=UPI00263401C5|nr:thermonuclease family protein [Devosia sp.]MDB5539643.1 yncB 2 [Devosia sp.]
MRAAIALVFLPLLAAPLPSRAEEAGFMLCEAFPHLTCVLSGDSFFLRGQMIRLSDIEAPRRYALECQAATQLSWKSAERLRDLLNAGPFELEGAELQADGAQLRLVTRDGKSLGDILVAEGLASDRTGTTPNWCE